MTKHIETAPERIWLQISENDVDAAFPFPKNAGDVTWCADSVVAVEVKYVRADLAEQQRDKLLAALTGLVEDLEMRAVDGVVPCGRSAYAKAKSALTGKPMAEYFL